MLAVYLSPLYFLIHVFVFYWLLRWLREVNPFFARRAARAALGVIYFFFVFSILFGFLMGSGRAGRLMNLIGDYWLGISLYGCSIVIIFVILYLIFKHVLKKPPARAQFVAGGLVCLLLAVSLCAYGMINAHVVRKTDYELTLEKSAEANELKIALISDLHMGYNIGVNMIGTMVNKINAMDADIVLIAGDIFDNDYAALEDADELSSLLSSVESTYGTYAVWGNHDVHEKILAGFTFGNGTKDKRASEEMESFLENSNITLLADEALLIDDAFYVVGRRDSERTQSDDGDRLSADQLIGGLDKSKPIIVIDHEPSELAECAAAGADIELNGHTHDGQVFPANIITDLMWENSYGYLNVNGMHQITSSGVGVFGPFMRTATISEVCEITVHFAG